MEYVTLNNGVKMPMLGFGVFQVPDGKECEESVYNALMSGYRLIDTAAHYMNEKAVGRAIKRSGIPREEIFITSKLWIQDYGYESAKKAYQTSIDNLGVDYLDLYLIHYFYNDYYSSWRAMEDLYKEGKVRAIGVSNFEADRLVDLIIHNEIVPAVNQIEYNPIYQRKKDRGVMKEYNVQAEAWGPFAEAKFGIFQDETLTKIAKKYGKSVAQVILRWDIQNGFVTIPKSVHKERIVENFDVFDFKLCQEDMDEIDKLDKGKSGIVDYHDPEFVKRICASKIHD